MIFVAGGHGGKGTDWATLTSLVPTYCLGGEDPKESRGDHTEFTGPVKACKTSK